VDAGLHLDNLKGDFVAPSDSRFVLIGQILSYPNKPYEKLMYSAFR